MNQQDWREQLRERLQIVYQNGIIDGKQGTNCEDIVIEEAIKALQSQRSSLIEEIREEIRGMECKIENHYDDEENNECWGKKEALSDLDEVLKKK